MPGTMFIQPAALAALPTSGGAWDALVSASNTDPGSGNLGLIDQLHPLNVFSIALRWARDGGGLGKQRVIDEIAAVPGTEMSASQPLNPYRTIGAYIMAADLVDMPGSTICANGQSFDQWVASLFYKTMPAGSNANWDTLYKCTRISGNNWGFCARTSALAVALWMMKHGLSPTGVPSGAPSTATGVRDVVINNYKRSVGDTSVPNSFVPAVFDASKDGPNTTYPTTQGTINPVSSDGLRNGFNCEDGSRDSAMPPVAAGIHYQYESLDSAAVMITLLINAGYGDAAGWGNSGVRRNVEWMIRNNRTTPGQYDFDHQFWMQPRFWNHLYGVGMAVPSGSTTDRYDRRMLTTHTDWLTSPGSTWLKTAGDSGTGGGGGTTTVVAPTVSFTLPSTVVSGSSATANASATTVGSAAITGYRFNWGDGTYTPSATTYQTSSSASHTYAATATVSRTVTVTAIAADGGTDSDAKSILVTVADGKPVAQISLGVNSGTAPLVVPWNMSASFDPNGDPITNYRIDWGDGIVTNSATPTGSRTFSASVSTPTSYTGKAYVTAAAVESVAAQFTVTILPAITVESAVRHYIALNGQKVPVLPPYSSAWDGPHLTMDGFHFWVSPSDKTLRVKDGPPAGEFDGTPIGASAGGGAITQLPAGTSVPASTPTGLILFY